MARRSDNISGMIHSLVNSLRRMAVVGAAAGLLVVGAPVSPA
jgi:hypothetical protein